VGISLNLHIWQIVSSKVGHFI